jgi:hypothetical protein
MGLFDKLKKAVSSKLAHKKNELEDTIVGKIVPGRTSYTPPATEATSLESSEERGMTAHEVEMQKLREANELRAAQLEGQMQERMLAKGGLIDSLLNAQTEMMDAATEAMQDANKKKS